MSLADLPPLRESLAAAGLLADKRLGQHFLLDLNICRKIARLADPEPGQTVLEIGPGPGGLTRALLENGARVVAVERDERFLPLLADIGAQVPGQLTIVHADALRIDEIALAGKGAMVVANLPYNIGTPLLIRWLTGTFKPSRMTLMFQKEVAARIVAPPGSDDYGRLAVIAQFLAQVQTVMDLPARAFTPPPKVASAVVRLIPHPERPPQALIDAVQTVTAAAFGQRRKMLRSALRGIGGEALCARAEIDPNLRAETIPIAGFLALAHAWLSMRA